jgi:hypothetical protein
MRRTVAVLIVAVFAVSLAGCGGSQPATTAPAPAPAAAPAVAPAPAAGTPAVADRSVNESDVFLPFPTGEVVPAQLNDLIVAKQPTLIFFYSGDQTSSENRKIIDKVRADNRGLVDLVTYNLGKYVSTSEAGTITVDPKFASDPAASEAVTLAQVLGVTNTPFVVLTDSQGYIIWKFRGLLDSAFLEREILRAAR